MDDYKQNNTYNRLNDPVWYFDFLKIILHFCLIF